jgi:hypothetical protein
VTSLQNGLKKCEAKLSAAFSFLWFVVWWTARIVIPSSVSVNEITPKSRPRRFSAKDSAGLARWSAESLKMKRIQSSMSCSDAKRKRSAADR